MRIGFIGAGWRATEHMSTLEDRHDVEIAAVCDVVEEAAREAAADYDAAVYTDHAEMYESEPDLDAVFVVLPPFAHADQEILAAERGIHLFVEKPLALSMEKAEEIHDAIEANDVIAAAGYQLRYSEATQRAAELLDGRPLALVEGYYKSGVPTGPDHWWSDYEKSGGQVVEQATHIYDLVRKFGGEVESVSAIGGHEVVEYLDFEDAVAANLVHEGGTVGQVTSTSAAPQHNSGVEIVGEDLQLRLSGSSLSGVVDGDEIEFESETDPSEVAVETFVDAVASGEDSEIRSDYADAMESLALTLAVEDSLDAGDSVRL